MEQARITNQQPSQGHQAVRGKQPSQARDAAGQAQDSGSGGFLSLLAALGDGVLQDGAMPQDGGLVLDEQKPVATDVAAQDGAVAWPWMTAQADATLQAAVDANAMSGGMATPSSGRGIPPPEATQAGVNTGQGSFGSLDVVPKNGLVAQTALLDSATKVGAGVQESGGVDPSLAAVTGGVRRTPSRVNGGLVSVGGLPTMGGAQAAQALKTLGGAKDAGVMQTVQAAAGQVPGAERHGATVSSRDGMRFMGQDQAASMVPLAAMVSSFSDGGGRSMSQGGDRGAPSPSGVGAQGANAESQGASSLDAGAVAVDSGMAGTEDAVAEQVAFWVRQNIQNAEMTIQHDGQAVEVSVSLTGNEAHVSFGSDQAETRSLLDGSVAQLREMLRQEGLSLSGVTVGESGQRQGSEESGRSNQQSLPRKTVVEVPAPLQVRPRTGASHQTDRSIDIFV
jgi:flagellar hook-length control protein FliK